MIYCESSTIGRWNRQNLYRCATPGTIELINERKNWQPPQTADFKQLAGLGFQSLGGID
jgi:hypothetical protein